MQLHNKSRNGNIEGLRQMEKQPFLFKLSIFDVKFESGIFFPRSDQILEIWGRNHINKGKLGIFNLLFILKLSLFLFFSMHFPM